MTQWVIVVYLCSPLVAPSPSTCFSETYGIYQTEEACRKAEDLLLHPDPRTALVWRLECSQVGIAPLRER
jgi:hypothetical protein